MLLELEVSGFAVVDHLVLEFESGMTVLTGETGAGKSIILGSLGFLLGMGPKSVPPEGEQCRVAGKFLPTPEVSEYLESHSLPVDEQELFLVRERRAGGRTISRLNGSLVSASQLKELSRLLVDLHGQHQSYGLTRPSTHLPMLDRLAGAAQSQELATYSELYATASRLRAEIEEIQSAERQRLREMEWLSFELEEIGRVAPRPREDEELEAEIRKLSASEDVARGLHGGTTALKGDSGALDRLATALSELSPLPRFDPALSEMLERLRAAEIEVEEVARDLSAYADSVEHDPARLDALLERAESLKTLRRKYGPTIDDVLAHQEKARQTLERMENSELFVSQLSAELAGVERRLEEQARVLTERRRQAAETLQDFVVEELAALAMPSVRFLVEFTELTQPGPNGAESIQFLFSPNPGRRPTPLAETASGGELSRVMLALVSILSRHQPQPTLIFDEIDVGLGGRTAEAVAERLAGLAQRVQVLCVTHLPVVAAAGSGHYVVEKSSDQEQTTVSVRAVAKEDRIEEIARMLSGDSSPKTARKLAADLLKRKGKPEMAKNGPLQ